MSDVTHRKIEEIDAIEGVLEGIAFYKAATGYPEHDHSEDGLGGRMFAKRPQQLGQEEVYAALKGSGSLEADGEQYALDADHIARVGAEVKRKITPGPDGIRLLVIGGTPGEPYDTGGTL
jgi:hypothetical protein